MTQQALLRVGYRVKVLECVEDELDGQDVGYEPGIDVGDEGTIVELSEDIPPVIVQLDKKDGQIEGIRDAFWGDELERIG